MSGKGLSEGTTWSAEQVASSRYDSLVSLPWNLSGNSESEVQRVVEVRVVVG